MIGLKYSMNYDIHNDTPKYSLSIDATKIFFLLSVWNIWVVFVRYLYPIVKQNEWPWNLAEKINK